MRIKMGSSHGYIGEFNSQLEDWHSYIECLQNYFIVYDIKSESKQHAILLSVCGPRIYKLIHSLLSPQEPKDVTLADIIKEMTNHYLPKPSIIVQHFKFHSCSRKAGESVAIYITELKRLSKDCAFGNFLQEMLRGLHSVWNQWSTYSTPFINRASTDLQISIWTGAVHGNCWTEH